MGFLKKIFKPVSKVLDKIVPNEIKPALPYLSAFAPMMLGPGIMATYKEIKGVTIQTKDSDPVLAGAAGGSWSSGGNLNNGVVGNAGFGTYTAAVSVAGTRSPGLTSAVEHYDGSSWTTATAIPTATGTVGACGTRTAGLIYGGQTPGGNTNSTFEYEGENR